MSGPIKKAYVEKKIESPEIYQFLSNVISKSPRIAIIVEQMTGEIREASDTFPNVQYVEFKTYVSEDAESVRAHLFEPIYKREKPPEEGRKEKKERKYPPYMTDWEKRLEWVNPSTRTLVNRLIERVETALPNVTHGSMYR